MPEDLNCAVVLISHLYLKQKSKEMYRDESHKQGKDDTEEKVNIQSPIPTYFYYIAKRCRDG